MWSHGKVSAGIDVRGRPRRSRWRDIRAGPADRVRRAKRRTPHRLVAPRLRREQPRQMIPADVALFLLAGEAQIPKDEAEASAAARLREEGRRRPQADVDVHKSSAAAWYPQKHRPAVREPPANNITGIVGPVRPPLPLRARDPALHGNLAVGDVPDRTRTSHHRLDTAPSRSGRFIRDGRWSTFAKKARAPARPFFSPRSRATSRCGEGETKWCHETQRARNPRDCPMDFLSRRDSRRLGSSAPAG